MTEKNIDIFKSLMNDDSHSINSDVKNTVELLRSEIDLIPNVAMRKIVSMILSKASFFWNSPSSNIEDQYPPDEYKEHGLVLHTKRTVRAAFCLSSCYALSETDTSALFTACLLHGICIPVLPNISEEDDIQIFSPHYMIEIDQFLMEVIDKALLDNSWPEFQQDVDEKCQTILDKAVRLIHCCEGLMSPIPELYPKTNLEIMMASANVIAKSVHVIVDGVDINYDRWNVETEIENSETIVPDQES